MKKIFNDIIAKNILKFICYHPLISITIFIFIVEIFLFSCCVNDINNIKIWDLIGSFIIISLFTYMISIFICLIILLLFHIDMIFGDDLEDWYDNINFKINNITKIKINEFNNWHF